MLVDEGRKTLDDSRWVPRDAWGKVNAVAMRHDSKGVVVFAAGHVETVPPRYGFDDEIPIRLSRQEHNANATL